jgi:hypothetical protein
MVKLLIFMKRKPGLSRQQFIDYYENNHIVLIARHFGEFQTDYRRSYAEDAAPFGLTGVADSPESGKAGVDFDVLTEIWLKDRATMDAMFARNAQPDIAAEVAADEENFVDRASVRFHIVEEYPRR